MLLNPSEAIERSSSSGTPSRCDPFEIAMSCTSGRSFVQAEEILRPCDSTKARLESVQMEVRRVPSSSRAIAFLEQAVMIYSRWPGVAG